MNHRIRKGLIALLTVAVIAATSAAFHLTQSFSKHFFAGCREFDQKNFQMALVHFSTAANIDPDNSQILKYLASTYDHLGRDQQTLDTLETLGRLHPDDTDTVVWIADMYYKLGDFAKAQGYYQLALSRRSTPTVQSKLAEVLAWQGHYHQAVVILENLSQTGTGVNDVLLADLYTWSQQYDKAADLYRRLMDSPTPPEDILLKLADALRLARRDNEAIIFYTRYLKEHHAL